MYNKFPIFLGIIIFATLATSPIWINASGGKSDVYPSIELPANQKQCVDTKEFMRHNHMDLLNNWRDMVVRQDQRYFKTKDGKDLMINGEIAELSLSNTCLKCHTSKAKFCDQCHNYLDVKPYCWDCHVDPASVREWNPNIHIIKANEIEKDVKDKEGETPHE
jgi:hypothetical protein